MALEPLPSWYNPSKKLQILQMFAIILLMLASCTIKLSSAASQSQWLASAECAPCTCHLRRSTELRLPLAKVADCSNLQLDHIPNLPEDIDKVDLTGNRIATLDGSELDTYSYLKAVILADNELVTLPQSLFQNNTLLQYLDLSGLELEELSEELFTNLEFFEVLKGASIANFPADIFQKLSKLRILDFSTSQEELPDELFDGLSLHQLSLRLPNAHYLPMTLLQSGHNVITLKEVSIVGPKLLSLDAELFDNLTLLQKVLIDAERMWTLPVHLLHGTKIGQNNSKELDVHANNRITLQEVAISGVGKLPEKLFHHLPNLESLSLHKVYDIHQAALQTLTRLDSLDLSQSNFNTISVEWFKNLQGFNLKSLNLSHNELTAIGKHDLAHLYSLKFLDLSMNQISELHIESFRSFRSTLEYLDVGWNKVCTFSQDLFMEMWGLRALKLNDNECFDKLPGNLFQNLEYLEELHLQGNKIEHFEPSQFDGQPDLAFLNVSGNALRALPNNLFEHTTSITVLDLSDNEIGILPDLLLDRKDQSLLKVVLARGNPIHCDCGVVQLLWLAHKPDVTIEAVCGTPPEVAGRRVITLALSTVCQKTSFLTKFDDQLEMMETPIEEAKSADYGDYDSDYGADPVLSKAIGADKQSEPSVVDNAWFQGVLGAGLCAGAVAGTVIMVKQLRGHLYGRTYIVNKV